jgi:hypothetical protein
MKKQRVRIKMRRAVVQMILNIVGVVSAVAVTFILFATLAWR